MRDVWMFGQVLADVTVEPTSSGMPGADLIQQLLNWLAQGALWGSLAALLGGAGMFWVSSHGGNYVGASRGKMLAVAGLVGACVAGVAPTAVNLLFSAAR